MKDDKSKKKLDATTISLSEKYEVDYWCKKFDCTKKDLESAVEKVGKSAKKVEEYFKNK